MIYQQNDLNFNLLDNYVDFTLNKLISGLRPSFCLILFFTTKISPLRG